MASETTGPTIWIDGDGVPRPTKEIVFKASLRTRVSVILVANSFQRVPKANCVRAVKVGSGFDVADDYIAETCQPGDLVITSDIPLAARVIEAGGTVIRFRGEEITADNVRQRLESRDFMEALRGSGVMTGGPPAFGPKDRQHFANALDRWISRSRS
jgi:uncharacterized protein YaiI (UPF0178 family)